MVKVDLKIIRLPLIVYYLMAAMFIALLVCFPSLFQPYVIEKDYIKSTIFYISDLFLPLFAASCIILQLGASLEKSTYEFLCSLNETNGIFIRWLLTLLITTVPLFISIILSYHDLTYYFNAAISFGRLVFVSFANFLLLCSLSLLLTILLRRVFYVFCIIFGYSLFDLFMGMVTLREFSLFVNISASVSKEALTVNRMAMYAISLFLALTCTILIKFKFLQRFNGKS